jgi:hypothetical protein
MQIKLSVILHTTVYVFTYEHDRISQDSKTIATLTTHYTPYDKERMYFSSCTSHT